MRKKFAGLLLTLVFLFTNVLSTMAVSDLKTITSNNVYENVYNVEFANIDLNILDDTIHTTTNSKSEIDNNLLNLVNLLKDEDFSKSLKSAINNGYRPIRLAAKEIYSERIYNAKTKKTEERFLTNAEVQELTSTPKLLDSSKIMDTRTSSSSSTTVGKLTLTITVFDSSVQGDYWVQSNASWDTIVGFLGSNTPAPGLDFIGTGWNSKYCTKSNPSSGGSYVDGTSISPYVSDISQNEGTIWAFNDFKSYGTDFTLCNTTYAGVGVRSSNCQSSYCAFSATYGHTYDTMTYSANIASQSSITISPSSSQWSTAVSVSGYFY